MNGRKMNPDVSKHKNSTLTIEDLKIPTSNTPETTMDLGTASKANNLLWESGVKEISRTDAASANATSLDAQQGSEQSGNASVQNNDLSGGKGKQNYGNNQINREENAENATI